jgi:Fur family transcriptional regulator, ferric uptake regulator
VSQIAGTMSRVERQCVEKGLKMTGQRRVIARVLSDAGDHPDANEVFRRAIRIDPHISLATVYRTVRVLEEKHVLERRDFGDGRARYEESGNEHHDHLIDVESGRVIEFHNDQIEKLQKFVAEELGFRLVGHRLELYGTPLESNKD